MRYVTVWFLLISATCLSCNNPAEAGNARGQAPHPRLQATPLEIQINNQLPNADNLEAALKAEFLKTGQSDLITFEQVEGQPTGDRYLVVVGKDVPPSLLMRLKKVLRIEGASSASFRTDEAKAPHRIYIGQPVEGERGSSD
jgi:hypothetical protein